MQMANMGVEEALSKAGGNRKELFQVIRHYQDSGDSLKLKAALFLIENMADKYYLTGNVIDEYYTFIDSVYQIKQPEYHKSRGAAAHSFKRMCSSPFFVCLFETKSPYKKRMQTGTQQSATKAYTKH